MGEILAPQEIPGQDAWKIRISFTPGSLCAEVFRVQLSRQPYFTKACRCVPLLWLSIFFLCGILLISIASLPWGAWAGGVLVFFALSFLEKRWSALTWLR